MYCKVEWSDLYCGVGGFSFIVLVYWHQLFIVFCYSSLLCFCFSSYIEQMAHSDNLSSQQNQEALIINDLIFV